MDKLLVLALKGDGPLLRWLFDQSNSSLTFPPQFDDTLGVDSIDKELFKSFVLQYIVSSAEEFLSKQSVDLTTSNPNATKETDGKKKIDKTALELNDANFPALGRPVVTSTVATSASVEHGRRHIRRIAPTVIPPSEQLSLSSKFLKPLGEEAGELEALPSVPVNGKPHQVDLAVLSPPVPSKVDAKMGHSTGKPPSIDGSQVTLNLDRTLEFPPCARILALLHASILGYSSSGRMTGHLSASLELLLRLLATVGEGTQRGSRVQVPDKGKTDQKHVATNSSKNWSARLAQEKEVIFSHAVAPLYAASVFCYLPNLLGSLPPEIIENVQNLAMCFLKSTGGMPETLGKGHDGFNFDFDIDALRHGEYGRHLLASIKTSIPAFVVFGRLHKLTKVFLDGPSQLRTEKSYDRSPSQSSKVTGDGRLHGISKFASDGRLSVLGTDPKKRSNREACRDKWMEVYRFVLDTDACTTLDPSVFEAIQYRVSKVIRGIAYPENFVALAEFVIEMVLKAAALGTPEVDDAELSHLAKGNTSRIWALNRRIREGPERVHTAMRGHNLKNASRDSSHRSQQKMDINELQQFDAIATTSSSQATSHKSNADALLKSLATDLLPLFAEPVRPIVLCLEAGDSHRFNQTLVRMMSIKLMTLQHDALTSYSDLAETVVISSTLASFIGYLSFYRCFMKWHARNDEVYPAALHCSSSLPLDPEAVLVDQCSAPHSGNRGILHILPWIVRYLRFAQFDPYALNHIPSIKRTLAILAKLRQAPELSPSNPTFGRAALCIQALLDELNGVIDRSNLPQHEIENTSLRGESMEEVMAAVMSRLSQDLKAMDSMVDLRCLEHCLPFLSNARKSLFSKVKVIDGPEDKAGQLLAGRGRRITPSLSGEKNLTVVLANKFRDAAILAEAAGKTATENPVKVRLQRAFLDQYNQYNGVEIGIRRIVDLSSEAIALNAATNILDTVITMALERVRGLVLVRLEQMESQSESHLDFDTTSQLLYLQTYAEEELIRGIDADLQCGFESERLRIRSAACSSVIGLLPGTLKRPVLETAAALVAESAEIIAAKQLSRRLDDKLQQQWLGQVKSVVKHVIKKINLE